MAGRITDFKNRQEKFLVSTLSSMPAGSLLNRLLYLIDHINVSLGFIKLNGQTGALDCLSLVVDEEITLQQEISEFLGLLFYMQKKYGELLIPHRTKIISLKNKLGIYFV